MLIVPLLLYIAPPLISPSKSSVRWAVKLVFVMLRMAASSLYIAPPRLFAVHILRLEFVMVALPLLYIPPPMVASVLIRLELFIVRLAFAALYIAPPFLKEPEDVMFEFVIVRLPLLLIAPPSIVEIVP